MNIEKIKRRFAYLGTELVNEIFDEPIIKQFDSCQTILKAGQYITHIPFVLNGLIKVFTRYEDKDLLLYYIKSNESCIMSFSSGIKNEASIVFAVTECETEILLLPIEKIESWMKHFPRLNLFFFNQYNLRYVELLETINHLIFDKLDKRLFDYLVRKSGLAETKRVSITHRQIAEELGTAREVVSRILKKLEKENLISIDDEGILINKLKIN